MRENLFVGGVGLRWPLSKVRRGHRSDDFPSPTLARLAQFDQRRQASQSRGSHAARPEPESVSAPPLCGVLSTGNYTCLHYLCALNRLPLPQCADIPRPTRQHLSFVPTLLLSSGASRLINVFAREQLGALVVPQVFSTPRHHMLTQASQLSVVMFLRVLHRPQI